jgi:hypothetical protein
MWIQKGVNRASAFSLTALNWNTQHKQIVPLCCGVLLSLDVAFSFSYTECHCAEARGTLCISNSLVRAQYVNISTINLILKVKGVKFV